MPFYPSIGAGGHCIPVDPAYLVHAMDECGENTNYISEALKINLNMKNWVLEKMAKHMGVQPSNFQNKKILFLGVAYKGGISDLRHSSAIELIKILEKNNANVEFWDEKVTFIKIDDSSTKYKFDFTNRSLIDFDLIFINYLNEFPLKEDLKNTKTKIFDAQLNPLKLNTLNYTKI
jgi:UDP-N-acetyl-D-glucosamine dehydrogenase